jgi:glycolate oxidase FAD binding subunit
MPVPRELAAACTDTAPAGPADVIGGRRARYVAAPASTQEASALLRAAAMLGLTVVPRGAGRLQHWGDPPVSCDLIVDTRRLDQVVEHRPDDFAVTVQAGVRVRYLAQALAPAHQHLAVIPPFRAATGTVGGLIATNAAGGMRRYRYGRPGDLLTGITAVRADGTIIRSGEFASTVTGQDLVTLLAGSYGTLALITEASFRLHPLPQVSGGTLLPCSDPGDAERKLAEIASDSWLAPIGIDLRWPARDKPLGLVVTIEGDKQSFQARNDRLHVLAGRQPPSSLPGHSDARRLDAPDHGGLSPAAAQEILARRERFEADLRNPPPDTGTLVRVSFPPGRLAAALDAIQAAAARNAVPAAIEGPAGVGVLDVTAPAESPAAAVARFVPDLRAELGRLGEAGRAPGASRAVVVYAPDEVRELTDTRGPVPSLELLEAVKDEFDPEHRMAPGRFAQAA